jgi:hypothetical protein
VTPSDELLDVALAVVGEAGLSGLTWEQIDERAGIAAGTTASLFPTIDVLVEAMLGRLITLDGEAWLSTGTALNPTSAREFADRMAALTVSHVEIIGRATRARLALFLGRPEAMSQGQAALLDVITVILDTIGVPDPATRSRHVADLVGGTALHALTVRRDEPIDQAALAAAFWRLLR